ncbi:hypothetical protein [Chromobacterium subtsugae]|uniref:hypothetical protein n=1 Tax=Chromobacterium subtsugae TaxID=251747 RepID=UPI000AC0B7D6|nr:hypothetical protein [Chromobacterium subtsugae]
MRNNIILSLSFLLFSAYVAAEPKQDRKVLVDTVRYELSGYYSLQDLLNSFANKWSDLRYYDEYRFNRVVDPNVKVEVGGLGLRSEIVSCPDATMIFYLASAEPDMGEAYISGCVWGDQNRAILQIKGFYRYADMVTRALKLGLNDSGRNDFYFMRLIKRVKTSGAKFKLLEAGSGAQFSKENVNQAIDLKD